MCFNETEYVNLKVFDMTTGINESKSLVKDISFDYRYRLNGKKYNSK